MPKKSGSSVRAADVEGKLTNIFPRASAYCCVTLTRGFAEGSTTNRKGPAIARPPGSFCRFVLAVATALRLALAAGLLGCGFRSAFAGLIAA